MKNLKKLSALVIGALCALTSVEASAQILYKVEKPGDSKVSYLLGTHHFAPVSMLDSLKALPEALKSVDKLYGEIVMADMTKPENMMVLQQAMMAPQDSTLDKVLKPAELDSVSKMWSDFGAGVPLEMLYPMKPGALSAQIASLMAMKVMPEINPMEGIDQTMQNRAAALGKPVGGFETVEQQAQTLFGQPIVKQARDLMNTVRNIDEEGEKAVKLSQAYLNHDMDTILKMMTSEEGDEADYERLLYSRNDNWLRQLTEELPTTSVMVVVGAGHLPGPRGVIEGLRKAGYTVTPVE